MNMTTTLGRIESTIATIRDRNTAYHPLMERFEPFFIMQEKVREAVRPAALSAPTFDKTKLDDGQAVLSRMDMAPWSVPLMSAAETLLPVIIQSLTLEPDSAKGLQKMLLAPDTMAELVRSRLDDGPDRLVDLGASNGITPPEALPFAVDAIAGPVLGCLAELLAEELAATTWERGHCPFCGSAPSIAHLALPESGQSEYLVGGGGKKFLHCSLCGHDWHFTRTACAACGNKDDKTRDLLFVDGAKHERIEICRDCGTYLLCVDLREYAEQPDQDVLQPGLIHLDILAREQHLRPLASTLWNTLT